MVDLCFFSDEDDRLASVDIGGTIALWDLDLYPGEDMTNVINGTLLAGKSKAPLDVYVLANITSKSHFGNSCRAESGSGQGQCFPLPGLAPFPAYYFVCCCF